MSVFQRVKAAILGTPQADVINGAKQDIVSSINQHHDALKASNHKIRTQQLEMPPKPALAVPDMQPLLQTAQQDFQALDKKRAEYEQLFRAFRIQHGLMELPSQPSKLNTLLGLGVGVVLESFVNVAFFTQAHLVAGPAQALLTSALISSTNVFASASVGYFYGRWTEWGLHSTEPEHPSFQAKRSTAKNCVKWFIPVMGFFHITVAGIRAQENLDHIVHSIPAYFDILSTPESLFLMLSGACMTLLSYYKGKHGFSDPYPQYTKHAANIEATQTEKHAVYKDYTDEVTEHLDEALEAAEEKITQYNSEVKAFNQSINDAQSHQRQLLNEVAFAQNTLSSEASNIQSLYDKLANGNAISQNAAMDDELSSLSDLSDITATIEAMALPTPLSPVSLASFQDDCEKHRQATVATLTAMTEPTTNETHTLH